ncbi:hypothetical protein HI806_20940 (plasmid) [Ralstonia solanacearum]|nr:hypothetical protein HI806_20940 [Ralstonia solanacearum]QKL78953.1 hypothetical protein HI805_20945 [Ralstonia solanacearum]QKL84161.1 hypothetical protein HI804_20950 [Ralstonia solanacearum]QKL89373.1 hypothetical protein HI803_20955 [Ralstonia solanacearum]QKM04739.1 hypothetical protein HI800_20950 [Ralstonia solanacearum]
MRIILNNSHGRRGCMARRAGDPAAFDRSCVIFLLENLHWAENPHDCRWFPCELTAAKMKINNENHS